jgi:hypothetical protein
MPLIKFRSFREAEEAMWCFAPDPAYYQRIRQLFTLASRISRVQVAPGVSKFRSLEEREEGGVSP